MYFITEKSSETGKKFQEIENRAKKCHDSVQKILKKYNVTNYCSQRWEAYGGIEILVFDTEPDQRTWKKSKEVANGYTPNLRFKEGKEVKKEFDALPKVSRKDLNDCIGFGGAPFKCIGFNYRNDKYFGFSVCEDWNVIIPEDCEEITHRRYKEIFP